ncbi:hypothetical protein ACFPJ1_40860 [Kribbella qitaiheensis]|uniref:hypothetical protein n=1 Tax=Kribbella qitaiheensis TaxID=1544730 RepID=UPI00361A16DA
MTAPADHLLAAADLLDKRAGEATEGPWRAVATGEAGRADVINDKIVSTTRGMVAAVDVSTTDGRYIASLDPEKGKLIAKILRAEAERLTRSPRAFGGAPLFKPQPDTLALADALLAGGEQS